MRKCLTPREIRSRRSSFKGSHYFRAANERSSAPRLSGRGASVRLDTSGILADQTKKEPLGVFVRIPTGLLQWSADDR